MARYRVRFSEKGYYIQRKLKWTIIWEELINTHDGRIIYFSELDKATLKIKELIEKDKTIKLSKGKDKSVRRKTYRG